MKNLTEYIFFFKIRDCSYISQFDTVLVVFENNFQRILIMVPIPEVVFIGNVINILFSFHEYETRFSSLFFNFTF